MNGCKEKVSVIVPKGLDYKEVLVECGCTGPTGYPVFCERHDTPHNHRAAEQRRIDAGERIEPLD